MSDIERMEADKGLAPLLERVTSEGEMVITRNGEDVARVKSIRQIDWPRRLAALDALRKLRKVQRLDGLSVKELIEEGRH